jgi:hypothetical protein
LNAPGRDQVSEDLDSSSLFSPDTCSIIRGVPF